MTKVNLTQEAKQYLTTLILKDLQTLSQNDCKDNRKKICEILQNLEVFFNRLSGKHTNFFQSQISDKVPITFEKIANFFKNFD